MAAPIPNTVVIDQARDFYLTVNYLDSSGNPIDLTAYTASFVLGQPNTATLALTLSKGAGITLGNGTVNIHATAAQTNIASGTYNAELIVVSTVNVQTSLLKGQILVSSKVAS